MSWRRSSIEREHVGRSPLGEPRPALARDARHRVAASRRLLLGRHPARARTRSTGSRATAARARPSAPQKVADRSARWSSSCRWSSSDSGVVALGDEVLAHVAEQQRAAPPVAAEAGGRADHGVVDRRRHGVEQARGPHLDRPAPEVAEAPHGPVDVGVQVLEHEGLAVDDDPLERRAGLAVGATERPPLGGAGDELVDRRWPPRGARAGSATSASMRRRAHLGEDLGSPAAAAEHRVAPRSGRRRTLRRCTWWAAWVHARRPRRSGGSGRPRRPRSGAARRSRARSGTANQPWYSAAIGTGPCAWNRQPGTVASRRASSA